MEKNFLKKWNVLRKIYAFVLGHTQSVGRGLDELGVQGVLELPCAPDERLEYFFSNPKGEPLSIWLRAALGSLCPGAYGMPGHGLGALQAESWRGIAWGMMP